VVKERFPNSMNGNPPLKEEGEKGTTKTQEKGERNIYG